MKTKCSRILKCLLALAIGLVFSSGVCSAGNDRYVDQGSRMDQITLSNERILLETLIRMHDEFGAFPYLDMILVCELPGSNSLKNPKTGLCSEPSDTTVWMLTGRPCQLKYRKLSNHACVVAVYDASGRRMKIHTLIRRKYRPY
jgi:hypothetical protein